MEKIMISKHSARGFADVGHDAQRWKSLDLAQKKFVRSSTGKEALKGMRLKGYAQRDALKGKRWQEKA